MDKPAELRLLRHALRAHFRAPVPKHFNTTSQKIHGVAHLSYTLLFLVQGHVRNFSPATGYLGNKSGDNANTTPLKSWRYNIKSLYSLIKKRISEPMDIQKWFDVAYSVHLAGLDDHQQLVRCMFIRCGKRESIKDILRTYEDMVQEAKKCGYTNPMEFIIDCFPELYTKYIRVYNKSIDPILLENFLRKKNLTIGIAMPSENSVVLTEQSEHAAKRAKKTTAVEYSEPNNEESFQKHKIIRPSKLVKEHISGNPIEIPLDFKNKITKHKKSAKYYREMGQKEKEMDNRFDYFLLKSKKDETGKFFYDNKEQLKTNPLMGSFFSDFDVEFRKIMAGIYNHNRQLTKDKSRWQDEINIFKSYFEKKLDIEKGDDSSTKRLASAVAYLMKKLQTKIFESDDPEIVRILLYFKTQLYLFYNFYRK